MRPPTMAGVVNEEENWARIAYFLERVVPVAEAHRVRLACHPHDPYTPPGWRGVTRVLGTVQGLQRFVQTCPPVSRPQLLHRHGGRDARRPRARDRRRLRWFGERGMLFNVHFRNIRGGKLSFTETFPEEGDMDMPRRCGSSRRSGIAT
jgi:mannonate dehydratase